MYKNSTYREKFAHLKAWFPSMIEAVKKDLRNEHLKKDAVFARKFLSSKNIHRIGTEELAEAYQRAVQEEEQGEQIAEFITSRWLLNNSEIYEFFESQLSAISPDFTLLEELTPAQSKALIDAAEEQFGLPRTYIFSVLNSVVFPKEVFLDLQSKAEKKREAALREEMAAEEQKQAAHTQATFERELSKQADKYEKKLQGLQKKYTTDVDRLKKQLADLQRKLQGK